MRGFASAEGAHGRDGAGPRRNSLVVTFRAGHEPAGFGKGSKAVSSNKNDNGFEAILNHLDVLVYVADLETHDLLFINDYGRKLYGEPDGKKCWQLLQSDQSGPCGFCNNALLLDVDGEPNGVHVWEFQNTRDQRWYECRDQALRWDDGRLVRVEVAIDITERKRMREELAAAKLKAEALAHADELTGLDNRRAFFSRGLNHFRHASRHGCPVAVIMFDLDYFKQINDTYGHFVGDKVLLTVARTLKPLVRDSDILGRLGGEEFALILPETGLDEARMVAERLRAAVAGLRIEHGTTVIRCTSSFGVAACEDGSLDLDELLGEADDALYLAKHGGRNRVEYMPSAKG